MRIAMPDCAELGNQQGDGGDNRRAKSETMLQLGQMKP
jgi:hypothetical protein